MKPSSVSTWWCLRTSGWEVKKSGQLELDGIYTVLTQTVELDLLHGKARIAFEGSDYAHDAFAKHAIQPLIEFPEGESGNVKDLSSGLTSCPVC